MALSPWAGPIAGRGGAILGHRSSAERRHFAQLPEVIEDATFSDSLGMRRASFASRRSRRLTQNLTIAGSTRKFVSAFFRGKDE
jgi:hypothetical protein